jgi:hypothetical protein
MAIKGTSRLLIFLVVFVSSAKADDRPTVESLVGVEYSVEDRWAGMSFMLEQDMSGYSLVWRTHGSGVRVISETRHPVEVCSPWLIESNIGDGDPCHDFMVGIHEGGEVRAFLNGIRVYITKMNI